jgi:hypothetical protein
MSNNDEVLKIIEKNIDLTFLHQFLSDNELDQIATKYKKENLSEEDVMKIIIECMTKAEKIKGLTGEDKKKFVENLTQNIFVTLIKSGFNALFTFVPVLGFLSPIIEIIVSATKGLVDINKVKKCCSKIFPCCKKQK